MKDIDSLQTSDKFSSVGIWDNTSLNLVTGHCELDYRIALYQSALGCYTITRYRRQGHLNNKSNLFSSSFWRLGVQDQVPAALVSAKTSLLPGRWSPSSLYCHMAFLCGTYRQELSSNGVSSGVSSFLNGRHPCDLTTYLLRSSISQNGHIAS